jgi:hypothetical protein
MSHRIALLFASFIAGASPVIAAGSCPDGSPRDAEKIAEAIDIYASEPFSARTWRVLKGLGDPGIDQSYGGTSYWTDQDHWRKQVADLAPDIKQPTYYGFDCRLDYPVEVLDKRIGDLGPKHPYVKQWITVQTAVLAACSEQSVSELPPPLTWLEGDMKALQDFDRAYQGATLVFYKDKAQAIDIFRSIAGTQSPHRPAARYMVANALANAKQLEAARKEADEILADPSLASVHEITQELLGYIANLEDTAQGWTDLLEATIAVLETPASEILGSEKLKADYARALTDIDFAGIRGKSDDWWLEGLLPENPTISKAIVDMSRKHAMVPWMIAGQTANDYYRAAPWQFIGPKWEDRTQSLVDRSMALVPGTPPLAREVIDALKARPDDASRSLLWDRALAAVKSADESCGTSPETAAAGILLAHAVRLSAMAGKFEDIYKNLETLPIKSSQAYYRYTVYPLGQYLLGQGMVEEARRYRDRLLTAEFLAGLPPVTDGTIRDSYAELLMWIAEDEEAWLTALGDHSRKTDMSLLNFLPARKLRALAKDQKLFSAAERALLVRMAWTRTIGRGKTPEKSFSEEMFALNPELKVVADKVAADYPEASEQNRRLLTILRTPRYGILASSPGIWEPVSMTDDEDPTAIDAYDHNDKNWWCPFETDRHLIQLRSDIDTVSGSARPEWFRKTLEPVVDPAVGKRLGEKRESVLRKHPMVRGVDWKEVSALAAMPSAPKRLSRAAVNWGKTSKGKDGAPEALALAVKTTRYGCNWHGGHGSYSKAAHDILHKRFGDTAWAAQTPYWFDCTNFYDVDPEKKTVCKSPSWPKQKIPR